VAGRAGRIIASALEGVKPPEITWTAAGAAATMARGARSNPSILPRAVPAFHYDDDTLCSGRVRLADIARVVGTPCYVYNAGVIRDRYRTLDAALGDVPHALHYAFKANSALAIVRLLRAEGAHADVNSGGELDVALAAGYAPRQIVFTGVGKSRDELERGVELDLHAINVESRGELERVAAIAARQGRQARVALRVNPDVDAATHRHITTGTRGSKFGVPRDEAVELARWASRQDALALVGLHFHIGSQIVRTEPFDEAAAVVGSLVAELASHGVRLEHLDLGGGLGISYEGDEDEPAIAKYAAVQTAIARRLNLPLLLEPGRVIVGPAGALLARVVDTKLRADRRVIVLDAGMTELVRPALYGARHRIVPVRQGASAGRTADVVGPVCESSDAFGTYTSLPDDCDVDSLVAVLDAGAYGASMASTFIRRPLAPEVLVDGDRWSIIRRRQRVADLLDLET